MGFWKGAHILERSIQGKAIDFSQFYIQPIFT